MRGFNAGAVIPQRNLADVIPRRFNLIVRLHPEKEPSEYILMPESVKRHKDSTRGWFGTVIAAGESVKRMKDLVGVIKAGTVCMFDETVSIDDPNRCFEWENERYVMFDIETVIGVLDKKGKITMLGDRVLVRRTKKEDYKQTASKLWIPEANKAQDLGGVVVAVGPGLPGSKGRLPMDFKAGDFVLFSKFSGTEIKIKDVDHIVIRQDKLLAVVEGETDRIKFT
jgi:chaperonin GroES